MHAKFCADCNFLILVTELVDKTVEQDTAQPENIRQIVSTSKCQEHLRLIVSLLSAASWLINCNVTAPYVFKVTKNK